MAIGVDETGNDRGEDLAHLALVAAHQHRVLERVLREAAQFDRIGSLTTGSDVRVSGIKVGTVTGLALDPKTFLANVRMSIDPSVQLPDDTVAEIVSAGLLGDKYLSLVPGGSEKDIPPGGRIKYTQSSVSLEHLIGQMMFSPTSGPKKPDDGAAPGAAPQAAPTAGGGQPAAAPAPKPR